MPRFPADPSNSRSLRPQPIPAEKGAQRKDTRPAISFRPLRLILEFTPSPLKLRFRLSTPFQIIPRKTH